MRRPDRWWPWALMCAGNLLALATPSTLGWNLASGVLIWGGVIPLFWTDVREEGWRSTLGSMAEVILLGGTVWLIGVWCGVHAWWIWALMAVAAIFAYAVAKAFLRAGRVVRRERERQAERERLGQRIRLVGDVERDDRGDRWTSE